MIPKNQTFSLIILFLTGILWPVQVKAVPEPAINKSFSAISSWDFENEPTGTYTDQEIGEDFDYIDLYSHNGASIVADNINGQPTKVLRILQPAGILSSGFEMAVDLGADYHEIYLSYNWKFSEEYNSTLGGKMPGFAGMPIPPPNHYPLSGEGFWATMLFKRAGFLSSYHYDRTNPPEAPWGTDENCNIKYLSNGTWYNITQRLVMNTFTNGIANGDGINEVWVDGVMVIQESNLKLMENESANMKIDAFFISNFYGGSSFEHTPQYECYGYIDNIVLFRPDHEPVSGNQIHLPSEIFETPNPITDRRMYFDSLRTTPGNLSNSQYGSTYGACLDEAYLVDAGEGNTITFTWDHALNHGDYLLIYDGNTTDAPFRRIVSGSSSQSNQSVTSSGRYLFIRFSTDKVNHSTGWSGALAFSGSPAKPTSLHLIEMDTTRITFGWSDNSDNEIGFEIQRSAAGSGFVTLGTVSNNVDLFTDFTIETEVDYIYRVRAFNNSGQSSFSDSLHVLVPFIEAIPLHPTNLRAVNVSFDRVQIEWTDNSNVESGFELFRSDESLDFDVLEFFMPDVTSHLDLFNIRPGKTYFYKARAFNSHGFSEYSNILQVTIPPEGPVDVPVLKVVDVTSNSVELTWGLSGNPNEVYILSRKNDAGESITFNNLTEGNYVDQYLDPNSTYSYQVHAIRANSRSNSLNVSTLPSYASERTADGLIALYIFNGKNPDTISDQSWFGQPADLVMKNGTLSTLKRNDYISIVEDNVLVAEEVGKISEACRTTNEITIECWIKTANDIASTPSKIFSMEDDGSVAFSLSCSRDIQSEDQVRYFVNLTTNATVQNGKPDFFTEKTTHASVLQHIIYTRNESGDEYIYVNNELIASSFRPSDFNTWLEKYDITVANNMDENAPWHGDIYMLALYNKSLSAGEIASNYLASPFINDSCILNSDDYQIIAYPNPASNIFLVSISNNGIYGEITQCYTLSVFNQQGFLVDEFNVSEIINGESFMQIPIASYKSGIYTLVLSSTGGLIDRKKVIVLPH